MTERDPAALDLGSKTALEYEIRARDSGKVAFDPSRSIVGLALTREADHWRLEFGGTNALLIPIAAAEGLAKRILSEDSPAAAAAGNGTVAREAGMAAKAVDHAYEAAPDSPEGHA